MKLSFALPHLMEIAAISQPWEAAVDGPAVLRIARRAEELGYDMVAVPEHLAMPPDQIAHSGSFWLQSTVAQAALAGATSRIRINSAVTILPLHHPVMLAKMLATADWLSGGRIMASFGLGSMRGEYAYFGVPFERRGAMADEYLAAMIALWTQERPSFEGEFVRFRDVGFDPKPVQRPHLPIWIGGDSDAALRRAARFASGWIVSYRTRSEDIPARIDYLKSQPTWRERPFDVSYSLGTARMTTGHAPSGDTRGSGRMSAQEIIDELSRYKALGVTSSSVPVPPVADEQACLDYAQWVAEEVRPRL
ncbi:TIGR03619 family F420-dependent LLM class oxidoreductase [Novosphingobium bradum]|uniref:TIGR03619 family F420-dependent LLM class oxidoreductase n=1 Tax=Novosphingobium bradum TaxID=1737444 RepID=A0ABV7IR10_9SPHN